MAVRTNLVPNPRWLGVDGVSGGGSPEWDQEDIATDGPDGRGFTLVTATATQTGQVDLGTDDSASAQVQAGKPYAGFLYVRPDQTVSQISVYGQFWDAYGTSLGQLSGMIVDDPPVGSWRRLVFTMPAPANARTMQVRARIGYDAASPLQTGDTVGVACRMIEQSDTAGLYFDGDTPDTQWKAYAWTGDANASTSTETTTGPPSITAELLASSIVPPPVRLVLSNIPAGDSYVVTGIAPGGRTWNVAGGTGISTGVQIILDDLRAPPNVQIRYRLVVTGQGAGAFDSGNVVVPWSPRGGDPKVIVQSLDGKIVVALAAWIDNQLPQAPVINTTGFAIRGRARPVMVMATAGEGAMSVVWRLDRFESARLEQIIATGGGIALRTDGTARDLPVSDIAVITAASNQLWEADNGISTDRVWELELTWIDDPEPSSVPVVYTVDDVDGILAGRTVDEVDALFAGQTIDDVDQMDWGEVS